MSVLEPLWGSQKSLVNILSPNWREVGGDFFPLEVHPLFGLIPATEDLELTKTLLRDFGMKQMAVNLLKPTREEQPTISTRCLTEEITHAIKEH